MTKDLFSTTALSSFARREEFGARSPSFISAKVRNDRATQFAGLRTGKFEVPEGDRLHLGRGRLSIIAEPGIFDFEDLGDLGGSLLMVSGFKDGEVGQVIGTAVMIAPGVAVTATHVLDELQATGWNVDARGPGGGGSLTWWRATGFGRKVYVDLHTQEVRASSDLAVMALELAGDPGRALELPIPVFAPDIPAVGESVMVLGFQSGAGDPEEISLFASRGVVTSQHLNGRDRLMLPNPCLEVELDIWGGMSGGAVVNRHGELVGIASSSVQGSDRLGFVSLLGSVMDYEVIPRWPPGWYEPDIRTIRRILDVFEERAPAPPRPASLLPLVAVHRRR